MSLRYHDDADYMPARRVSRKGNFGICCSSCVSKASDGGTRVSTQKSNPFAAQRRTARDIGLTYAGWHRAVVAGHSCMHGTARALHCQAAQIETRC